MRITFRDGAYIAIATFEEQAALRKAGFIWHPGEADCKTGPASCLACKLRLRKAWWTRRPESAARLSSFADEFATKALADHLRAVEMSRATDSDAEIPVPKGLAYLGYQKAGIAYMSTREATLLGDEQGLGKTVQVLGVINHSPDIKNVLIVAPNTLRLNWFREAKKWLVPDGRKWNFYIVDSDDPIPATANFVIVHYQRISIGTKTCPGPCGGEKRKEIQCVSCKGTGTGRAANICCPTCGGKKFVYCDVCKGRGRIPGRNLKIVHSLFERKWDLLAVDEAHFVKNPNSSRTKAVIGNPYKNTPGLVHQAKKRLLLTGTPLPNRPAELWPLLSVCAPTEFGNFKVFARRYCDAHQEFIGKTKKVWKVDGASNLEELQERMRSTCLIRRLKRDVLKELPPKLRQVISLTPSEKAKKIIAEELSIWEKRFGGEIEMVKETLNIAEESKDDSTYQTAVERLKYIQNVAFMEMAKVRHEVAVAKIPMVLEHLESLFDEGVGKIICFAHHHDVLKAIGERFKDRAVYLYGETKTDDRQKAIDDFQNDPKVTLFVGGILAAGVGITLTASSHVVFAELDWVPASVSQAEDRCVAEGQPILTPNGWCPIEDIKVGDLVITRDGSATKIIDAWSKGSTKLMTEVELEGWQQPITTTCDHKYLLSDGTWCEAEHLRPGQKIAMPTGDSAHAPELKKIKFDDDCRISSTFKGSLGEQSNGRLIKAPNTIEITDESLFVFGYYIGDGFASIQPGKGRFVSFSGNSKTKRISLQRCQAWTASHKVRTESYPCDTDDGVEVRMFSGEWAYWFHKTFGHGAANKFIPSFLLGLNRRQSQLLLEGLFSSDGYTRKGRREYSTMSTVLAAQVALVMLRADHRPCVTDGSTGQKIIAYSEGVTTLESLVRTVKTRYPQKAKSKTREKVYDLTVENGSSFVVGLNVVHNCHRIGQVNTVMVQHLVLDGSLDARMAQLLVEKQEIADRALDRRTDVALQGLLPARPEAPAPPVSLWRKILLKESLISLAQRRDPATEGSHGFSQFDSTIGQKLATWNATYSDAQAALAEKIVFKYRRQLPDEVAKQLAFKEPDLKSSRPKPKKSEPELSILDRILT